MPPPTATPWPTTPRGSARPSPPALGEALEAPTVGFALAVMATLFLSRRRAVSPMPASR